MIKLDKDKVLDTPELGGPARPPPPVAEPDKGIQDEPEPKGEDG